MVGHKVAGEMRLILSFPGQDKRWWPVPWSTYGPRDPLSLYRCEVGRLADEQSWRTKRGRASPGSPPLLVPGAI